MKIIKKIILILLVLLGISSGIAKIMLLPQELEFFGNAGFSNTLIIVFGVIQIISGVLLVFTKTRLIAAIIFGITLAVSTLLIIQSGTIIFGILSTIPIFMLVFIVLNQDNNQNLEL